MAGFLRGGPGETNFMLRRFLLRSPHAIGAHSVAQESSDGSFVRPGIGVISHNVVMTARVIGAIDQHLPHSGAPLIAPSAPA